MRVPLFQADVAVTKARLWQIPELPLTFDVMGTEAMPTMGTMNTSVVVPT